VLASLVSPRFARLASLRSPRLARRYKVVGHSIDEGSLEEDERDELYKLVSNREGGKARRKSSIVGLVPLHIKAKIRAIEAVDILLYVHPEFVLVYKSTNSALLLSHTGGSASCRCSRSARSGSGTDGGRVGSRGVGGR
jgi:hypothetical protein